MKKLKLLLGILLGLIIISCSSEENNSDNNQNINGSLRKWTMKELNSNDEMFSLQEYLISNDKITNYILYDGNDFETKFYEVLYFYENGRLNKTMELFFGNLGLNDKETIFLYNNNGKLIEFITQTLTTNFVSKTIYEYDGNVVTSTRWKSTDNGSSFELFNFDSIIELTFDNMGNLIHSQFPGSRRNGFDYLYDINSNLVQNSKHPSTVVNYTYTDKPNPISIVNLNTFGKMGFSLFRAPYGLLFWNNISPNVLNSLDGEEIGSYFIDNTFVSGILTRMQINLDSFSDGTIDSKTINEFEYE